MYWRAATTWLILLVVAVVCGAARTALLQPRVGEQAAHVIGTIVGVSLQAVVIWMLVPWIEPGLSRHRLIGIGAGWLAATVLFEFGFGHYVLGHAWTRLLADYNVLAGRLWILVLVNVLVTPFFTGEFRRPQ